MDFVYWFGTSWDKFCKIYKLLKIPVISSYSTYLFDISIIFFLDIFEGMDKMYTSYLYYKKWYNHKNKLII